VIKSFACKDTEKVFRGNYTKKWDQSVRRKGQMKLDLIDAAMSLEDLKSPPGNRLHQLKGDLSAYHSISINLQWRVIFIWNEGNVESVKIVDYH
jgi:proteic killer suppression protein